MTVWPPSTNKLWSRGIGGKRVRSREYRDWRLNTGWDVKRQIVGLEPIDCRFDVLIEVPISRRDTDNWAKPVLDLCEHVGVMTNDGNAREVRVRPVKRDDIMVAFFLLPELNGVRKRRIVRAEARQGTTPKRARRSAPRFVAGKKAVAAHVREGSVMDYNRPCAFCWKWPAKWRTVINPPDDSTEIYKWFCGTTCYAHWSTNQPKPPKPAIEGLFRYRIRRDI